MLIHWARLIYYYNIGLYLVLGMIATFHYFYFISFSKKWEVWTSMSSPCNLLSLMDGSCTYPIPLQLEKLSRFYILIINILFEPVGLTLLKNPLGARWALLPSLGWVDSWLPTYLDSFFFFFFFFGQVEKRF